MKRLSLLLLALAVIDADGACQSCLMDLAKSGLFGQPQPRLGNTKHHPQSETLQSNILPLGLLGKPHLGFGVSSSSTALSNGVKSSFSIGRFDSPAMRFLAVRKLISVAYINRPRSTDIAMPMPKNAVSIHSKSRWAGGLFLEKLSESDDSLQDNGDEGQISDDSTESKSGDGEEVMSSSMIMAIGFYKQWISPLLPPACRFLPTCSQYGAQAIKEFGPQKGLILTAWRLARCTPLGGKGYDPPVWPPVFYTYGSY
ncbi:hypothetical protein ACHAXR_012422 [Thalassiosira sp. AJA248-18]